MSLNGLEATEVREAYVSALNEGGGWFLLKYNTRDEVGLLEQGHGGVVEVQDAVSRYQEESPLFGFIHYRRRKVVLKYVPEGTSRLLQARLSVHFTAVTEWLSPYDTVFTFAEAYELSDPALSSTCSLHTAASVRSTRDPPAKNLAGITEDASETSTVGKTHIEESASASGVNGSLRPSPPLDDDHIPGPDNERHIAASRGSWSSGTQHSRPDSAGNTSKDLPPTPPETLSKHDKAASLFQYGDNNHRASIDTRMSSQSARPSPHDMDRAYQNKPKVKLGPRPSTDSATRSEQLSHGDGAFRPKATLPASVRMPARKMMSAVRPTSSQSQKVFPASLAPLGSPPTHSLPSPPLRSPTTPSNLSFPSNIRRASFNNHGLPTPTRTPEPRSPKMTPEKRRLMKALQIRQKHIAAQNAARNFSTGTSAETQDENETEAGSSTADAATLSEATDNVEKTHPEQHEPFKDASDDVQDSPISALEKSEGPSTQASSITDDEVRKSEEKEILSTSSDFSHLTGPVHDTLSTQIARGELNEQNVHDAKESETFDVIKTDEPDVLQHVFSEPQCSSNMKKDPASTFSESGKDDHLVHQAPAEDGVSTREIPGSAVHLATDQAPKASTKDEAEIIGASTASAVHEAAIMSANLPGKHEPYVTDVGDPRRERTISKDIQRETALLGEHGPEKFSATPNEEASLVEATPEAGERHQAESLPLSTESSQSTAVPDEHFVASSGAAPLSSSPTILHTSLNDEPRPTLPVASNPNSQAQLSLSPATLRAPAPGEKTTKDSTHRPTTPTPSIGSAQGSPKPKGISRTTSKTFQMPASRKSPRKEKTSPTQISGNAPRSIELPRMSPFLPSMGFEGPFETHDVPRVLNETVRTDLAGQTRSGAKGDQVASAAPEEAREPLDVAPFTDEISHSGALKHSADIPETSEQTQLATLSSGPDNNMEIDSTLLPVITPQVSNATDTPFPIDPLQSETTENIVEDTTVLETPESIGERQDIHQQRRQGVIDPVDILRRASTPDQNDERFLSDDTFMDELDGATVQEAKPMSVSRSPIKPVFARTESGLTLADMAKPSRSVSSPVDRSTGDEQDMSIPSRRPTPVSVRSFSSTILPKPEVLSPPVPNSAQAKKLGVSSGISQRIKALEKLSSRPSSPITSATGGQPLMNLRRTSSRSPSDPVAPLDSLLTRTRSNIALLSPQHQLGETHVDNTNETAKIRPESVSVTATIVRDHPSKTAEGSHGQFSSPNLELHHSPLVVEHQPSVSLPAQQVMGPPMSPLKPPRPRYSRYSSARSASSSSNDPQEARRRSSAASKFSASSRNGSEVDLPHSISEKSSTSALPLDGIKEEKKGSRGSRLLKRMSSVTSLSRRSITQAMSPSSRAASIAESQEPVAEAEAEAEVQPIIDLGAINIQFPDTLLWKRRHMTVDEKGTLILAASKLDTNSKVPARHYHLSSFRPPYIPDPDRQELPNSVILDFNDGSTLQCATEHPSSQATLLKVLRHAYSVHVQ